MTKFAIAMAALLVAGQAIARDITLDGVARSVSLVNAIYNCGRYYPVDTSLLERLDAAFNEVGEKAAAQVSILLVTMGALVLAALFAERREHEAVLEESQARLQHALAAGSVTAFDWDVRSGMSRRSENAAEILGFDPQQTVSGSSFLARVHPDDRARFKALVRGVRPDNPSYTITFRFIRPDGREVWLEEASKAEFDAAGRLIRLEGLTRDITERKRAEERQNVLMAELDHRVKNVLARVAVVTMSTRQGSGSRDEFVRTLDGRIQSMATAHSLLSQSRWHGVSLPDLVRNQLAPYATDANMTISGADVMLSPSATQAVAMVLHELVTNGDSNKIIGRRLGIGEGTVKFHVRQIMRKFGVTNRTQVAFVCANGAR
jgi:PAS domain S-box-containing protein